VGRHSWGSSGKNWSNTSQVRGTSSSTAKSISTKFWKRWKFL